MRTATCVIITLLTVSDDNTSDGYHYMFTFNISGLSRQQQQPTSVRLHLHMMTSDQPTVINITIDQEQFVWRQSEDAKNETEARISLEPLLTNSQWTNDTLTVKVTSTNPIKLPTHQHYHPGLLLYMGGDPEAIDDLLATPLDKPTHPINDKKKGSKTSIERRDSKPCQLESFRITFSQVGGGFQYIIQPKSLDIGQCVGTCSQYLRPPHNPTQHAQIWNLLVFRHFKEGSGGGNVITPVSCTIRSYRPQPIVLYNPVTHMISYEAYHELVAASCRCSHCFS